MSDTMYMTVRQQIKHLPREGYGSLRELCHAAKNLYNEAVYNCRQYYFSEGKYLSYEKNYVLLKDSPNYRTLNSNMAQQILKEADGAFQSFFGLVKLAKKGRYSFRDCKLPRYLPKDGFMTLVIGFIRIDNGVLILPYSRAFRKTHNPVAIKLPPVMAGRSIKEIRIIPKSNARFFEIQYIYEAHCIQRSLNTQNALAVDFGVDNLMTAATNTGKAFIIDGRKLKAANQWYNRENARIQSVRDRQHQDKAPSRRQQALANKRNRYVNDYISKAAKLVVGYCIANDIGTLVCGYNVTFQRKTSLGKRNNQTFANIPFGRLRSKLEYLCRLNGIQYIEQEESYTSKASFWDKDHIPVYNADNPKSYTFSGKRVSRGQYRTASGGVLNADVNGALNILRKSNVVDLSILYTSGGVDTPLRIRTA